VSRAAVLALATEHGAEVFDNRDARHRFDVTIWLPAGKTWKDNRAHSLTWIDDRRPDGWKALLKRMGLGVEHCDIEHCDTCSEA
jgi:hypothetical protein